MNEAQFWQVIDSSRNNSTDCDSQSEQLQNLLSAYPAPEILEFDRIFRQKVIDAYRWDLWGIAYLINGGCSDDGFEYFCYWLIGAGSDAYRSILTDPQTILHYLSNDDELAECEPLGYAASYVYEEITGEEMPSLEIQYPEEPLGEPWEEDELAERFPQVAAKYL